MTTAGLLARRWSLRPPVLGVSRFALDTTQEGQPKASQPDRLALFLAFEGDFPERMSPVVQTLLCPP